MDYVEKLVEYRLRIKNEDTLKFVDFLETLFDWLDQLYKTKRLEKEKESEVVHFLPREIFEELDKISLVKRGDQEFENLKGIMLRESSEFINALIKIGHLRITDFDVFQFNLAQIFGKETIASMIETARTHLTEEIAERIRSEKEEKAAKEKAEIDYMRKIQTMPQPELNKLAINNLFDFTPSARTHKERLDAITNNRQSVVNQKQKFRNFERKLSEATEEAQKEALETINVKIGDVRRDVIGVSENFKEKAARFVSDEGPRKQIRAASDMILEQKEKLGKELEGKGKGWKAHLEKDTEKSRANIEEKTMKLLSDIKKENRFIDIRGRKELALAKRKIFKATTDFSEDIRGVEELFSGRAEQILERGQAEITKARSGLLAGKSEFESDVSEAKQEVLDKDKEIIEGKARFIKDVEGAKLFVLDRNAEIGDTKVDLSKDATMAGDRFTKRGSEVVNQISGTISKGRDKFKRDTSAAGLRFTQRAEEIRGTAGKHISGRKDRFEASISGARNKFLSKAEQIRGKPKFGGAGIAEKKSKFGADVQKARRKFSSKTGLTYSGTEFGAKAKKAQGRMAVTSKNMMAKAAQNREKMIAEINRQKGLFQYEVRFAKHRIQQHADQFAEQIATKQEEFETKQEQVISRHRVHQKAMLIRSLLRTIRGMH